MANASGGSAVGPAPAYRVGAFAARARHLTLEYFVGHPNVDRLLVIPLEVFTTLDTLRITRTERL